MAADARPAALALWAPILVICHQRHTLLLPRAVLAHHDDYACDDGKDSDVFLFWLPTMRMMMKTLVTVAVIHLHHTYDEDGDDGDEAH